MSSPDQWLENAIIFGVYPPGGGGGGGVTARQVQEFSFNYDPATGVDDAFIVSLTPAVTVLTDGLIVSMSSGSLQNNTDSPTLQVNALTPVSIVLWAGSVVGGDIQQNSSYLFIYNVANNSFQLINPSISTANSFLVQANSYNSAIDAGAVNAYSITLLIPPSLNIGFPVYMRVAPAHDNTGASTLTVNGVTADIVLNDGSPLPAGSLIGNQLAYFLYNGTQWVLMNANQPIAPFAWNSVAGTTQSATVNNGYIINNAALTTISLPALAAVGSVIAVQGHGAAGWIINASGSQTISGGSVSSSAGGSVASQSGIDNVFLLCVVANSEWRVTSTYSQGLTYS